MPRKKVIRTKFCTECSKPLRADAVVLYCRPHGEKIRNKLHHLKNKEFLNKKSIQYRIDNLERLRKYDTERSKLQHRKEAHKKIEAQNLKTNPNLRLRKYIRNTVYCAIKNNSLNGKKAEWLLGLPLSIYRNYLQFQFSDGMCWDNYGEWEIDHIIPLFKFDLTKEYQLLRASNFKNTQPLWRRENILKRNREMGFYG